MGSDLGDDFLDTLSDFLASFNHILENTCTEDVTECGLGTLHQGGTDAADTEGGLVGIDDVVVDDGCDVNVDIVFGHTYLGCNFNDGDFDIDLL